MERTILEVKNDLNKLGDVGMKCLFFYLSAILMMQVEPNWITIPFTIMIAVTAIIYAIWTFWLLISINDYNGANYIFNSAFECYLGKNTSIANIIMVVVLLAACIGILIFTF